jgi:hypothetical protein
MAFGTWEPGGHVSSVPSGHPSAWLFSDTIANTVTTIAERLAVEIGAW